MKRKLQLSYFNYKVKVGFPQGNDNKLLLELVRFFIASPVNHNYFWEM